MAKSSDPKIRAYFFLGNRGASERGEKRIPACTDENKLNPYRKIHLRAEGLKSCFKMDKRYPLGINSHQNYAQKLTRLRSEIPGKAVWIDASTSATKDNSDSAFPPRSHWCASTNSSTSGTLFWHQCKRDATDRKNQYIHKYIKPHRTSLYLYMSDAETCGR